jgi:hypothetical protein
MSTDYPALTRFERILAEQEGRVGAPEADAAIAALEEYLASGAKLGRGLRELTARFRPADETGAMLAYLYVVTVDAATHDGRDAALGAYAESGKPLADAARRLYDTLISDEFRLKVGKRPIQGGNKGCSPK